MAALVRRNKIWAIGENSYSSSVLSRRFRKYEQAVYVHAETNCIHSFLKKYPTRELSKCKMYILRVKYDKFGNWIIGNSTPCDGCKRALDYFNVKEVYCYP